METRIKTKRGSLDKSQVLSNSFFENPLLYGCLLSFCEAERTTEDLKFVADVTRFRDIFSKDRDAWKYSWRNIDDDLDDYVINIEKGDDKFSSSWPSMKVSRSEVLKAMDKIVDTYLIHDSPHEISIHSEVRANTLQRITHVDLYGPDVFTEATIEPLQTLQKNILPRFLKSDAYIKLNKRLHVSASLPSKEQLLVPPPSGSVVEKATPVDFPQDREFEFEEVMKCHILYGEFLKFLHRSKCSGNLLCVRLISLFEDAMCSGRQDKAENFMWTIYSYFIARGSAYEIQSFKADEKEFMVSMVKPTVDMFSELKYSLLHILELNFNAFRVTEEYHNLADLCRSKLSLRVILKSELSISFRKSMRILPAIVK